MVSLAGRLSGMFFGKAGDQHRPPQPPIFTLVAQLDKARDFYSLDWGFESLRACHIKISIMDYWQIILVFILPAIAIFAVVVAVLLNPKD